MDISIEQIFAPNYDLRLLIAELEAYLAGLYLPEQQHGWKLDRLFEPNVKVFLTKQGNRTVGCGCIALFGDYAEVKRMFVIPAARGQGLGRAMLKRLEDEAREAGMKWLRLETGHAQADAMRLYEAYGFHPRRSFGDYKDLSPLGLATSHFYEMNLQ
ncbi:MAG: GNAT family N-acetyltransferase [Acidocella sp.]|nr:GNAT family N-acetyltransferase [Acidocella sp.]